MWRLQRLHSRSSRVLWTSLSSVKLCPEVVLSSELRLLMSFSWPFFPGVVWTRFFFPDGFPGFWDSIPKRCKGVHCVDLGESFPTHIFLQNLASIQPRTSLVKFARSPRTDPPGVHAGNGARVQDRQQSDVQPRPTEGWRWCVRRVALLYAVHQVS